MQFSARPRLRRAFTISMLAASAMALVACQSSEPKSVVYKKPRSKEYFAETEYGVKASPYASRAMIGKRGGGRDQLGKPYQVRGKWYYPKEDKGYSKKGLASWYGEAFHGRLTANGEVYDMTHLTAAHPTMPLPSYARVTNIETGTSVIVRVNDRGPYHENRIIDVSKRAAEMLDYGRAGTAKVKVEYVGRAPLDGDDESYLEASYRPGNRAPDPSDGLPTGVMIAMNGPTPNAVIGGAAPFPGKLTDTATGSVVQPTLAPVQTASFNGISLPDFGPIVPERPETGMSSGQPGQKLPFAVASLGYASEKAQGTDPFAAMEAPAEGTQAWKRLNAAEAPTAIQTDYVAAGTFDDATQAKQVAAQLSAYGRTQVDHANLDGQNWYSVNLYPDGKGSIDFMLEAAWSHGAPDAFVVRD